MNSKKYRPESTTIGRPPLKEGERTLPVTIRLTEKQREKFIQLGGVNWLRNLLDQTK